MLYVVSFLISIGADVTVVEYLAPNLVCALSSFKCWPSTLQQLEFDIAVALAAHAI